MEEQDPESGPYTIRVMRESDLPAIVRIDRKITGRARKVFYDEKIGSCLRDPDLNTSLVAEADGLTVGFLMGRLFFGEFGIPVTRAVLDWMAVAPDFSGRGVARALYGQYGKNMAALGVATIDTLVDWDRFDLLRFFKAVGFTPSRGINLVWDVARYPFSAKENPARVRPATEDDLAEISAIDVESLFEARPHYFAAKLRNVQHRPEKNIFVVAEVDGRIAGFMVGGLYEGEFGIDDARGVIDSFTVREAFRHQGVGSEIMKYLLGRVNKLGVRQMETLCRWNDWDLLHFLEYVGFRPSFRMNLEHRLTDSP